MKNIPYPEIKQQAQAYATEAVELLSRLIAAGKEQGGTSGKEKARADIIQQELKKSTPHVTKDIFGNVIGAIGECEKPIQTIWFIGHIDTVAQGEWPEAFKPKIEGNKLYGRGSSDQLAGVVSSVLALKILANQEALLKKEKMRVVVMGNPHEEDCEGESIKYLLHAVTEKKALPHWLQGLPTIMITTEPTSNEEGIPRPYFGHRGRYLYTLKVQGPTGHGSVPLPLSTAEVFSTVVTEIFNQVQGPDSPKFGQDTYAFTTGSLTSPSHNAHTEVASWNIDFRIAPTSDPQYILTAMKNLAQKIRENLAHAKNISIDHVPSVSFQLVSQPYTTYEGYQFEGKQELPGPWLPMQHPLRTVALAVYKKLFAADPPYEKRNKKISQFDEKEGDLTIRDFYNFSTDLTGVAQLIRQAEKEGKNIPPIAYMGLGSGIEEQAHRQYEYCPINSLSLACAYYVALVLALVEEKI